jgi:hypothetical protein
MLPVLAVPGDVTVAVAPAGTLDTLAVKEAVEPFRAIVIPTSAEGTFGEAFCVNAVTEELASCMVNGVGAGPLFEELPLLELPQPQIIPKSPAYPARSIMQFPETFIGNEAYHAAGISIHNNDWARK